MYRVIVRIDPYWDEVILLRTMPKKYVGWTFESKRLLMVALDGIEKGLFSRLLISSKPKRTAFNL